MDGEFGQSRNVRSLWTRLWREIYGEPPPLADDPELMSRILVESLPLAPPYRPVDLRAFTRRPEPQPPSVAEDEGEEDEALRA